MSTSSDLYDWAETLLARRMKAGVSSVYVKVPNPLRAEQARLGLPLTEDEFVLRRVAAKDAWIVRKGEAKELSKANSIEAELG